MRFVLRGSIQFFINDVDIYITSCQVSYFFDILHDKKLIPMINEIFKYSENGFKRVMSWSNDKKANFVSHYWLKKEGCVLVCERIKPQKELKEQFLRLVEVSK